MALTSTQDNMVDVNYAARGSRTGTRTAADFTVVLGFAPSYIKVTNLTDRITGEWFEKAAAGSNQLTVAAGTKTFADAGIALTADGNGFTVTVATASLETDDDVVVWEAK